MQKCQRNANNFGPHLRARQREQASAGHDNLRGASQLRTARRLRRRRRSTVAVHTAIVVATVVVATARRLAARLLHTPTTAALHTAAPAVAAAATRALKSRTPSLLRVAPCSPRLSPLCICNARLRRSATAAAVASLALLLGHQR